MYEAWEKIETDFYLPKFLIIFKHQCYLLENSFLEQLHTDEEVVPTFGSSAE